MPNFIVNLIQSVTRALLSLECYFTARKAFFMADRCFDAAFLMCRIPGSQQAILLSECAANCYIPTAEEQAEWERQALLEAEMEAYELGSHANLASTANEAALRQLEIDRNG